MMNKDFYVKVEVRTYSMWKYCKSNKINGVQILVEFKNSWGQSNKESELEKRSGLGKYNV